MSMYGRNTNNRFSGYYSDLSELTGQKPEGVDGEWVIITSLNKKYYWDISSRTWTDGGSIDATLAAQGNINTATEEILQSITGNQYVSSNIDTEDATNYYFLSFIPGTTKWRINRLNKTSYVSDYAIGDSDIETAWTDRASQTYAIIY